MGKEYKTLFFMKNCVFFNGEKLCFRGKTLLYRKKISACHCKKSVVHEKPVFLTKTVFHRVINSVFSEKTRGCSMKNRVVQLKSRAIWWNIEELHGDKRWGQVTESGVTECICRAHFKFHALEAILKPYRPEKY